jgi:hypothetical protein
MKWAVQRIYLGLRTGLHYMVVGYKVKNQWIQFGTKVIYKKKEKSRKGDFDHLSFQQYGPGVDSSSNWNEYQEFSWRGKGWPVRKPDNLTAIYELTV